MIPPGQDEISGKLHLGASFYCKQISYRAVLAGQNPEGLIPLRGDGDLLPGWYVNRLVQPHMLFQGNSAAGFTFSCRRDGFLKGKAIIFPTDCIVDLFANGGHCELDSFLHSIRKSILRNVDCIFAAVDGNRC